MSRVLFFALLAFAVVWWLKRPKHRVDPPTETASHKAPAPLPLDEMVACAQCGTHLPREEALLDTRGQCYCCVAHRDAGPRDVP
jgi:uncharacterized protein